MNKLLAFYNDFIIVEKDNIWYMPDKIVKCTKEMNMFVVAKETEDFSSLNLNLNFISRPIKPKQYITYFQWSNKFDIAFAYCKEAGILAIK